MVGVPKNIKTRQDVLNLFEMSKKNELNKEEIISLFNDIKANQIFRLPIIEKGDNYFLIPKTERELPVIYNVEPYVIPELESSMSNGKDNEVFKIVGFVPKEDYIELTYPSEILDDLELTVDEINNMINELR